MDPMEQSYADHEAHAVAQSWSLRDGVFYPADLTAVALPAGFYEFHETRQGWGIRPTTQTSDDLLDLPGTAVAEVLTEFDRFWTLKDKFKSRGLVHKRGILLWGAPGTGKTAAVMMMSKALLAKGGLVFQIGHPGLASMMLKLIRGVEPDRPIICVLEDFDGLLQRYSEDEFLSLLDGENQVDGVLFVATTNHPSSLERRFMDRPSRFDTVREVHIPTAAARAHYLRHRDPTITNIDEWAAFTAGFSIAHLRELIVLVQCFEIPLHEATKRLRKMQEMDFAETDTPDDDGLGKSQTARITEHGYLEWVDA